MLDLVGEVVLSHRRLEHSVGAVAGLPEEVARQLSAEQQLLGELTDSAVRMRTLPVSAITGPLPRAIRDIAQAVGKQVEFTVTGAETELDRAILESLAEPLTHLLRNAVSHGIEPPEERRRAGKAGLRTAGAARGAAGQPGGDQRQRRRPGHRGRHRRGGGPGGVADRGAGPPGLLHRGRSHRPGWPGRRHGRRPVLRPVGRRQPGGTQPAGPGPRSHSAAAARAGPAGGAAAPPWAGRVRDPDRGGGRGAPGHRDPFGAGPACAGGARPPGAAGRHRGGARADRPGPAGPPGRVHRVGGLGGGSRSSATG